MTAPTEVSPGAAKAGKGYVQVWIYGQIFDAILEQRLAPGTKLAEDALGDIFGVSRTVIRAVLQRLSHDNVVDIRPNRGAVVASLSVREARDVFEARRVIEAGIIDFACMRGNKEDIKALRALVGEEQAAFKRGDRGTWIRLSGEFHLRLAEIAGNDALTETLRTLVSRTSLAIAEYEAPGLSACSQQEHLGIVDAAEQGDPEKAANLMRRHLEECEAMLDLDSREAATDLRTVFADVLTSERRRA